MTAVVYSPADSRGWGVGDYLMYGGALQPSDVYSVRVREHWRRKRRPKRAIALPALPAPPVVPALPAPPVIPALPAPPVRRVRRARIQPSSRVLRSAVRPVAVAAAPATFVPIGTKRRRTS